MSKTMCKDHLGNEYNSITSMCKHWGIRPTLYLSRIDRGWSIEDALTGDLKTPCKEVTDHLGNKYKSISDMCSAYGINDRTFKNRIDSGWDIERALTHTPNFKGKIESVDHLGNKFSSIDSMCRYWGIKQVTFRQRINSGWDIEKALTTNIEEKIVVDHLGNRFNSYKEMCKYWGISYNLFNSRINKGLSIKDSLTKEKSYIPKECKDHTGKVFKNQREMCRYWGVNETTFLSRLAKGLDVEQALTKDKPDNKYTDHLGQSFDSLDSMCKYWGISIGAFRSRIQYGWSISEALTTPINIKNNICKDHLGNEFNSTKEMAEHWGIYYLTFYRRIKNGWNLKEALTTPATHQKRNFTAFGKEFSVGSASKEFNLTKKSILNRFNSQWDIETSLVVTSVSKGHPGAKIQFIGLDGKAYYRTTWSQDPVTARQIIEHYRPDLLEAYDKYNPTGEYRPYKEGDKPCIS